MASTLIRPTPAASQILAHARSLTDPALRSAVRALPASMRRVAEYHFGWRDRHGRPCDAPAGKALRPALAIAAARATGGAERDAVPAAAAAELAHNFTLLHDDVMDRDLTRRHRPTAWSVFGQPDSILAGDALLAQSVKVLAGRPGAGNSGDVVRLMSCVIELCEGQHQDCAFEQRTDVDLAECMAMAEAKTGALLGCACALGAASAGAGEAAVAGLDRFGRRLGLAFQLTDDLLGIWGDPVATGKPVFGDLARRKKSLPVVAALSSGTTDGAELAALYHRDGELAVGDLRRAADLIEATGAREWAVSHATACMHAALESLATCVPDPRENGGLRALADMAVGRDR